MEPGIGLVTVPCFSGVADVRSPDRRSAWEHRRSLGFAILASYLCPDQRPIGYSITAKSLRDGYDKARLPKVPTPSNKASLFLTLGAFAFRDRTIALLTQGLGPQPLLGRVILLVNEWTNSAAEMLASFAQENDLAIVVGTKTAGNVLGARNFYVGRGYSVRIPVLGCFTWGGTCLEGLGLTPNVTEMNGERSSMTADRQMLKAIRIVTSLERVRRRLTRMVPAGKVVRRSPENGFESFP